MELASRHPHQSLFDEIQPIVAPEHFAVDEKRRRSERTTLTASSTLARSRFLISSPSISVGSISASLEKPAQRFLLAEILPCSQIARNAVE